MALPFSTAQLIVESIDNNGDIKTTVYILHNIMIEENKSVLPIYELGSSEIVDYLPGSTTLNFKGTGYQFWSGPKEKGPNPIKKPKEVDLPKPEHDDECWRFNYIDFNNDNKE